MEPSNIASSAAATKTFPCTVEDLTPPHHVSTFLLRALADVVQQRGISPETLLGHDTDVLYVEPLERSVPREKLQALFRHAVQLTKDPALGLQCGLHASQSSFGLMAPLVSHAPTLRRALALVAQFQSLLIEGARVQLAERAGVAVLRFDVDDAGGGQLDRSFVELIVAGLVRTVQAFGCTGGEIRAVRFKHARPAYHAAYTTVFAGAERFAQPFIGVEFSAHALDRPHLHHHSELHTLILAQAERSLKRLWRPLTCTERVRALVSGRPASQLPDMAAAARELQLSVRSLRRHLGDEGTSYRELTQSMLHESACSSLRDPAITLQAVAHELGFSDVTAFYRAFRRWERLTPAEYRAAFLGTSPAAKCQYA